MRLNSFLAEESLSLDDVDLEDEVRAQGQRILDIASKAGIKHIENVTASPKTLVLMFSNQIVDFFVEIKNKGNIEMYAALNINRKYHDDSDPVKKREIQSMSEADEEAIDVMAKKSMDISDWYFDVAMKYGKPKIFCDWTSGYGDRKLSIDVGGYGVFNGKKYVN